VYRFALRPRWILSHLFALVIVAGCVTAGFWQLDRHTTRRDANERLEERAAMPVVDVTELLGPDDEELVGEYELRTVEAVGTYRVEDQVTVANRTHEGSAGYWVLTPLVTDDGLGVVVNRGWVPMAIGEPPDLNELAAPPEGEVRVVGSLSASQHRGRFGGVDPSEGRLDRLARADIGRLAAQVDYPVLPAYVTLISQDPPQPGTVPMPVEPVELGAGPHLGYTFQWFTFATIAALGYPLILRKVARERAVEAEGSTGGERPRRRRRSSLVPVDD
jgi:cytochrome oxidase assembly protein ShyY1